MPGSPVLPVAAGDGERAEPGEVDLGAGACFVVVGGGDHGQVVDPGHGGLGAGGPGDGPGEVPAGGGTGLPPPGAPPPGENSPRRKPPGGAPPPPPPPPPPGAPPAACPSTGARRGA